MKFHCPGCQVTFAVPDEKIPEGRAVRILCPKCRNPVERADQPPQAVTGGAPASAPPPIDTAAAPPPSVAPAPVSPTPLSLLPEEDQESEDESSPLEVVEEGVKTCLLCCSDGSRREFLEGVLRELDFFVSSAVRVKHALGKLQHNKYDLVVLDEGFDGGSQTENLLLRHIQLLPMHMRRQFFLCLVSEGLPTLDQFLSFRIGVDMTVNASDVDKIKIILMRAMKDHSAFYKVYLDELGRKGQL